MGEDLIEGIYEYQKVDDNPTNIKYDFVSCGKKEVPKRVVILQYKELGLENYYNLGFGNITIDEQGIEYVSDISRDNNKDDAEKVLKTVLTCALDHLSTSTESKITFFGNTSAKHRLYKMQLNKHLVSISKYLKVRAGIINGIEIKESPAGKAPDGVVNLDSIEYEDYDPEKSRIYNFIIFELKDEYK